jgi:hypothetical protein
MDPKVLQQQVQEHRYEIDTLKETVGKVLASLDNNTTAQTMMATQFAVYAEKHDTSAEKLRSIEVKLSRHGEHIAAMRPVVDGIRGLVGKIVFASLASGGLVAIMITFLNKVG